jgi:hypothetical protein
MASLVRMKIGSADHFGNFSNFTTVALFTLGLSTWHYQGQQIRGFPLPTLARFRESLLGLWNALRL